MRFYIKLHAKQNRWMKNHTSNDSGIAKIQKSWWCYHCEIFSRKELHYLLLFFTKKFLFYLEVWWKIESRWVFNDFADKLRKNVKITSRIIVLKKEYISKHLYWIKFCFNVWNKSFIDEQFNLFFIPLFYTLSLYPTDIHKTA